MRISRVQSLHVLLIGCWPYLCTPRAGGTLRSRAIPATLFILLLSLVAGTQPPQTARTPQLDTSQPSRPATQDSNTQPPQTARTPQLDTSQPSRPATQDSNTQPPQTARTPQLDTSQPSRPATQDSVHQRNEEAQVEYYRARTEALRRQGAKTIWQVVSDNAAIFGALTAALVALLTLVVNQRTALRARK